MPGNVSRPARNCSDRHFVRGVEHDRPGAALFQRVVGQTQARKPLQIRRREFERAQPRNVERRHRAVPAIRIRKGVLNRQAHVGDAQLRDHRSVAQLDHRVHDRLRMDHDVDLARRHAEQPPRLDHLEPLVHQRRRIDGDLPAHLPGGMPQRVFRRDAVEILGRQRSERTAGRGQDQPPHFVAAPAVQALMDGVVLAVDRQDRHALAARGVHHQRRRP